MTTAAYDAMAREARERKLLTSYPQDLHWHDREALERLQDHAGNVPSVGWALRACGTHLFVPGAVDGVGHKVAEFPAFLERAFQPAEIVWFWWDGQRRALEQVTRPELEARLRKASKGLAPRRNDCG